MWLFPYLTWLSIGSIVALLIGMVILDSTRESLLLSVALAAVVVGIGVLRYRKGGPAGPANAAADSNRTCSRQARRRRRKPAASASPEPSARRAAMAAGRTVFHIRRPAPISGVEPPYAGGTRLLIKARIAYPHHMH